MKIERISVAFLQGCCCLLLAVLPLAASAGEVVKGVGVILGVPTGLSGKAWVGERTALDGAIGWDISRSGFVYLHANYLLHNAEWARELEMELEKEMDLDAGKILFYHGIGVRLELGDDSRLGVRVPVGINYLFPESPLDAFFELAPVLDLAPKTAFRVHGGIGIRYFFGSE